MGSLVSVPVLGAFLFYMGEKSVVFGVTSVLTAGAIGAITGVSNLCLIPPLRHKDVMSMSHAELGILYR